MKWVVIILSICAALYSCKKNKNSKGGNSDLTTQCTVSLKVGASVYNTSNYTIYNSTAANYQWDGLDIYSGYPVCSADNLGAYYQVLIWDTAAGAITGQALLQFDAPGVKDFTGYYSPVVQVYFHDTAYSGAASVSAAITGAGNHTGSGTFSLQGALASQYGSDSLPFSASVTFTGALEY